MRRRRLSHPSGREFESSLTTKTLVSKFRGQHRHVEHLESIENLFVTLDVCDVRPTELNQVSALSRNTNDVVDVVDKEELVVECELIVALVLRILDVIRVLLLIHVFVSGQFTSSLIWLDLVWGKSCRYRYVRCLL